MNEPSLFDEAEALVWQEVPQARFLSWSVPMQLAYCAARDRDMDWSARDDQIVAEIEWLKKIERRVIDLEATCPA